MKKILIFTFFLSLISQSFCISINQIADITGSFLKGTAQVSASMPLIIWTSLFGLKKWHQLKGGKVNEKSLWAIPYYVTDTEGVGIVFGSYLTIPFFLVTGLSNSASGMLLLLRNQSIFEVPLRSASPSSFLQGISVGCALLASMTYVITKFNADSLKQNIKYQKYIEKAYTLGVCSLAVSGLLSSLAGVAGLAEWAFAHSAT